MYEYKTKRVFKNGREIQVFVPTKCQSESTASASTKNIIAGIMIGCVLIAAAGIGYLHFFA